MNNNNKVQSNSVNEFTPFSLTVEELRTKLIGYIEPNQIKNAGKHGFRQRIINKQLADDINRNGLHHAIMLLKPQDVPDNTAVFTMVLPDVEKKDLNGALVLDGQTDDKTLFDFIVGSGNNRLLSLLAFGNKSTKVRFEYKDLQVIEGGNIQTSLSSATVFSKVVGILEGNPSMSVTRAIKKTGTDWSEGTINNNATSMKKLLALLQVSRDSNVEFYERLKAFIYSDQLSYNQFRKFVGSISKKWKEKYAIEGAMFVKKQPNPKYFSGLVALMDVYFDWCVIHSLSKTVSFSPAKFKNFESFVFPRKEENNNKEKLNAVAMTEVQLDEYEGTDNYEAAKNVHKYLNTLDMSKKEEKALGEVYRPLKKSYRITHDNMGVVLANTKEYLQRLNSKYQKSLISSLFHTVSMEGGQVSEFRLSDNLQYVINNDLNSTQLELLLLNVQTALTALLEKETKESEKVETK